MDNIPVRTWDTTKYNDTKFEKQKEKLVELQGGFKNLRSPMFDGESEEAGEA